MDVDRSLILVIIQLRVLFKIMKQKCDKMVMKHETFHWCCEGI